MPKFPIIKLRADVHPTVAWLNSFTIWDSYRRTFMPMLPEGVIYARGNLSLFQDPRCIAIVGTREPTARGIEIGEHLGMRITQEGYTIVSGMAKGCDKSGHKGALISGNTIAVLGSSLLPHEVRDREFARQILEAGGLVISTYSQGEGNGSRWKARNAIIAALGGVSIPLQSSLKSGTVNEMNHANRFDRPIWFPNPDESEKNLNQYEAYWSYRDQYYSNPPTVGRRYGFFDPYNDAHIATLLDTAEKEIKGILEEIDDHRSKIMTMLEIVP